MSGYTWECPKHHWDYRTCTCGTDSAESQLPATAEQRITPEPIGGNSPSRTSPDSEEQQL